MVLAKQQKKARGTFGWHVAWQDETGDSKPCCGNGVNAVDGDSCICCGWADAVARNEYRFGGLLDRCRLNRFYGT